MATCHGIQKDGMMLILSLEVLLSGDHVNPHREREAFVFGQPLHPRLLYLESHSLGSSCQLKAGPNSSKSRGCCLYFLYSRISELPLPIVVKGQFSQAAPCCPKQVSSSTVNFQGL
jgi:hypothetical protein